MNDVYAYGYSKEGHFHGHFMFREDAVAAGFENCPDASEVYVGRRVVVIEEMELVLRQTGGAE